jgi:hypothetical protein
MHNRESNVKTTHVFLHSGELDNSLIDGTLRDQPIHGNLTSLTESVSAIHGLSIIRRVPIVIIEYDSVGSGQVDTKTTSSCTEQEHEDVRSSSCELGRRVK